MTFTQTTLARSRPPTVRDVALPRRASYHPSPADWRDEVIYFLLPDRFSDGQERSRPLLDPNNRSQFRPDGWRWDRWAESGSSRYQGGNLAGIQSKLEYIQQLGATTLWIGPVFNQRAHVDSYHGYAIQDFLEVDPRLGTRNDLVDLINAAHRRELRVLLDVVFNHTGNNWIYANGQDMPPYLPWPQFYQKGDWRDGNGNLVTTIDRDDDGVWPLEMQQEGYYTRAGEGDLGAGDLNDEHAEFRRTDFIGDRHINYDGTGALDDLARCYKYWIALTDCDGFRIDTLKHLTQEAARNFCGTLKEFAANLGKTDFFLVGEVAGADRDANRYLEVFGIDLNATLDIGESRRNLHAVAKGLSQPADYLDLAKVWNDEFGSHRNSGASHVSILDDHDHVSGDKVRFSADASSDHQVVAGVALQLFCLGIPCIYYGTEQAFAGPEQSVRHFLPDYGTADRYLREAMFGPEHPRLSGRAGLPAPPAGLDSSIPGFGPFGTVGAHSFNYGSPAYIRIAALSSLRARYPVLRYGRQYERQISNFGSPFVEASAGELICWSRILDDEEALCIVNGNGIDARGGDVVVDFNVNAQNAPGRPWGSEAPFLEVIANTAQVAAGAGYRDSHPVGEKLAVQQRHGTAYIAIRSVPPSEVVVLINRPQH